jgi:hypothetical protein
MPHPSLPSDPLALQARRREIVIASVLTVLGLVAVFFSRGAIESMIAGSVGSVAAGCIAVALTYLDPRLTFTQRVQACLPIILMLAAAGFASKSSVLALAGYPLLLLGVAGLLPRMIRSLLTERTAVQPEEEPMHAPQQPALSN